MQIYNKVKISYQLQPARSSFQGIDFYLNLTFYLQTFYLELNMWLSFVISNTYSEVFFAFLKLK